MKPNSDRCVEISTRSSVQEMIAPGTYAILAPLIGGFLVGPRFLLGMLAGAVVYALVIANMTSVLANANVLYARHVDELAAVTQVLDDRDLPEGLRQRVRLEFEYV